MSLSRLLERASQSPARLLLAGGNNETLHRAAARFMAAGGKSIGVVGDGGIRPEDHHKFATIAGVLRHRAPDRVRDAIHALDLAADPLRFALGLCALDEADAVIAGPGAGMAELAESTQWVFGTPADHTPLRAVCWLLLGDGRLVAFAADCHPDPERSDGNGPVEAPAQARLGCAVAELHARLVNGTPGVALLPSRRGAAGESGVDQAVAAFHSSAPRWNGTELSATRFRGQADVLIFPAGVAGDLALQIAKDLSGATLLGPVLVGPPKVVAGVAESASESELVGTVAAAALLAAGGSSI